MGHMGHPGLSAAQKADLWQRWKQGQSFSEIGRALGKHAGSIHGVVSSNGGFIPAASGSAQSGWRPTPAPPDSHFDRSAGPAPRLLA